MLYYHINSYPQYIYTHIMYAYNPAKDTEFNLMSQNRYNIQQIGLLYEFYDEQRGKGGIERGKAKKGQKEFRAMPLMAKLLLVVTKVTRDVYVTGSYVILSSFFP